MDAIVYTSNTGFTQQYATMLGEELELPVYSLKEAKKQLRRNSDVIYLGWLMASIVKGYRQAERRYNVQAVCGVGMGASGTQIDDVRKVNRLQSKAVFTLQGGFDLTKLKGINKLLMQLAGKGICEKLQNKPDKTQEEADMLDLYLNGGSRVDASNLQPVINWYDKVFKPTQEE